MELDRQRQAAEYERKLAEEKAAWEEATELRIAQVKEATRKQVSDEFSGLLKAEKEDKERWVQKATQLEAQVGGGGGVCFANRWLYCTVRAFASAGGRLGASRWAPLMVLISLGFPFVPQTPISDPTTLGPRP